MNQGFTQPPIRDAVTILPIRQAKIFGREKERSLLMSAYEEASSGLGLVQLVAGRMGSGKTALVHSLRDSIRLHNGLFIDGKYSPYQKDIPLFAIRQALCNLGHQLLLEEASMRAQWIIKILGAVGELGQLITNLAPELEALLGPQPAVREVNPIEAIHRFDSVLGDFFSVFCNAEHPLLWLMDDCQWADTASLSLLARLRINTSLHYIMLVASYRSEEVDTNHPFACLVKDLHSNEVPTRLLELNDLSKNAVQEILVESLSPIYEDLDPLTQHFYDITHGNPLFVRLLVNLYKRTNSIWFDATTAMWRWDSSAMEKQQCHDLVEVFLVTLQNLTPTCREMLSIASCIGFRFALETLALAVQQTLNECQKSLREAIEQNLISLLEKSISGEIYYIFNHDFECDINS